VFLAGTIIEFDLGRTFPPESNIPVWQKKIIVLINNLICLLTNFNLSSVHSFV